jgi:peptidoglycan hydrolase-like protein with peptidoglycan-binding domain
MSVGGIRSGGVGVGGAVEAPAAAEREAALASAALRGSADLEAIARGERTIASGSRGDAVKKLQQALMAAGYALPRYGADGGYGAEGMAAVKKLQRDAHLPETGIVDRATLLALDQKLAAGGPGGAGAAGGAGGTGASAGAATLTPPGSGAVSSGRFQSNPDLAAVAAGRKTLGPGAKGEAVKAVQQALLDTGFALPKYGADGGYGAEMALAVRRFQMDQGLPRTGKVDKATLAALDRYAPPPGKRLERYPEYDRIYEDGRADMTLAFGYDEDGAAAGQIAETLRGLQAQGFRKVNPDALSAADRAKYGLGPDQVDPGISYWVKDFKDPATGKNVCAVTKILTPDSAPTPEAVAKLFQKAIERDDVVMYDGHARYGTGPDFDDIDSGRGNFILNPSGNAPDLEGDPPPKHLLDALKGRPLSAAETSIPKDKYRLLFFDGCSTENYIPGLKKNMKGVSNDNVDIVGSTMPLSFATGPTQLLNFVSGVTGRKSIDEINRANNAAEARYASPDEKLRAENAMFASGFLGNRANRVL